MLYDKTYLPNDYFDIINFDELLSKINELLESFKEIFGVEKIENDYEFFLDLYNGEYDDINITSFLYIEYIDIIERCIKKLAFEFYQPPGYIENKIWIEDYTQPTYKNISYIDINRMITDINLLYIHRTDTISIYNLYTNEEWNTGVTSLKWEE